MEKKSPFCTLTDQELAVKADQWIDELIASGGKSFTMQVPARPNADTDLMLAELNNRFKKLIIEPKPGPVWVKGAPSEDKPHYAKVPSKMIECLVYKAIIIPKGFEGRWWAVGDGFAYDIGPDEIIEHLDESPAEQPVLPTFWDVAKAFKWAAEYNNEKGEHLMLADGWCLMSDGGVNEELTPGRESIIRSSDQFQWVLPTAIQVMEWRV